MPFISVFSRLQVERVAEVIGLGVVVALAAIAALRQPVRAEGVAFCNCAKMSSSAFWPMRRMPRAGQFVAVAVALD